MNDEPIPSRALYKLDCEGQSSLLYDINFSFVMSVSSAIFCGGSGTYRGDVH